MLCHNTGTAYALRCGVGPARSLGPGNSAIPDPGTRRAPGSGLSPRMIEEAPALKTDPAGHGLPSGHMLVFWTGAVSLASWWTNEGPARVNAGPSRP